MRQSQSQQAYKSGDGARAKELSNQAKEHERKMEEYNQQASNYIFRANNSPGRVEGDCIDLHGLYVEEAERVLEERIRADQARGQDHLHAIVGKGNHSTGHVQKIKPKVEELCRELGLKYRTEENAGRIIINLQGGEPLAPGSVPHGYGGGYRPNQQQQQHGGYNNQHGGQQQPHYGNQQQQGQQNDDEDSLPNILLKLQKMCCTVM